MYLALFFVFRENCAANSKMKKYHREFLQWGEPFELPGDFVFQKCEGLCSF